MIDLANYRRQACDYTLPDEFWIISTNTAEECYSAGIDLRDIAIPDKVNGLPLKRHDRGGKLTYTGPGQLVISCCLRGRDTRILHGGEIEVRDIVKNFIMAPIADYFNARFDLGLTYNDDDPGLYDRAGKKVMSYGFMLPDGYIAFFGSINLATDLEKFRYIDVCGVANRPMRNIYDRVGIDDDTVFRHGNAIVDQIWERLYAPADQLWEYQDSDTAVKIR